MSSKQTANNEIILYTSPEGKKKVEVIFQNETFWLTQKVLAELFAVQVPAVNKHLKNIFESGELAEESVISILETTAVDGKRYKTKEYEIYRTIQDEAYISDFDKEIKRIESKK